MISVELNKPAEVDLCIHRGVDSVLSLTVTDDAGAAINLTGYTVRILVASAEGSADNTVNGAFTIGGGSNNVLTYTFTAAATSNTASYPSECYYEVQWLDTTSKYRKLAYGRVTMVSSLSYTDTP
jgi:hypothetical protein